MMVSPYASSALIDALPALAVPSSAFALAGENASDATTPLSVTDTVFVPLTILTFSAGSIESGVPVPFVAVYVATEYTSAPTGAVEDIVHTFDVPLPVQLPPVNATTVVVLLGVPSKLTSVNATDWVFGDTYCGRMRFAAVADEDGTRTANVTVALCANCPGGSVCVLLAHAESANAATSERIERIRFMFRLLKK